MSHATFETKSLEESVGSYEISLEEVVLRLAKQAGNSR